MWTERFYTEIFKEVRGKRKGIHVSSLTHSCLRRAYYDITRDAPISLKEGTVLWIGKKLHTVRMSKNHELSLGWEGIRGTVDEYEDGYLMDKKSTRNIPSVPRQAHVRQLEMYRVLLKENGYKVEKAAVLYIDVDTGEVVEYPVKFKRKLETVEKEMLRKKEKLEMALSKGWLPERHISGECYLCPFPSWCFTEGGVRDPRREVKSE